MAKLGIVKLKARDGCTSIGMGGEQLDIVDGIVEVPADLAQELMASHGFTLYEEPVGTYREPSGKIKPIAR